MSYLLKNQNQTHITVKMNNQTWYGILEMAEDHDWNPLGTVVSEQFEMAGFYGGEAVFGDYWSDEFSLVLLEDALNLADALEQAYLDYEPVRLPSLNPFLWNGEFEILSRPQPGIGVIQILIAFFQAGAFTIERI